MSFNLRYRHGGRPRNLTLGPVAIGLAEARRLAQEARGEIARIDAAMLAEARRLDPSASEIPRWTFHDLRRTCASGMASLGVAPHVVESTLNHASGTIKGVAAVYNRYRYETERRAALEAWGRRVEQLATGEAPSNVVTLRTAKAEAV
jgi:integrase